MTTHDPATEWATRPGRHIVSLSGGKDSTALAIFLKGKVPNLEYIFCDTDKELPETYEYLDRLEAFLQQPIMRLNAGRGFDHWLTVYGGVLPSAQTRWCTRKLKIEPFEQYVGDDQIWSYIGIRADENRDGYISAKKNITPVYPFKEYGLKLPDIERLLTESGMGLPTYYEWRQRSGCYFCFFQRSAEWVGLKERHPELFEQSKRYEEDFGGVGFYWRQREQLAELEQPERVAEIKRLHTIRLEQERQRRPDKPLIDLIGDALDAEDDEFGCNICHL